MIFRPHRARKSDARWYRNIRTASTPAPSRLSTRANLRRRDALRASLWPTVGSTRLTANASIALTARNQQRQCSAARDFSSDQLSNGSTAAASRTVMLSITAAASLPVVRPGDRPGCQVLLGQDARWRALVPKRLRPTPNQVNQFTIRTVSHRTDRSARKCSLLHRIEDRRPFDHYPADLSPRGPTKVCAAGALEKQILPDSKLTTIVPGGATWQVACRDGEQPQQPMYQHLRAAA
jgi:hypothetical protein